MPFYILLPRLVSHLVRDQTFSCIFTMHNENNAEIAEAQASKTT